MSKLISAETRIQQINALPNIEFVRWADEYKGTRSKAVCRCKIDGHEWATKVNHLIHKGSGCAKCAGNLKRTDAESIELVNSLPNISFVRWESSYKNNKSKAICRCEIDGHEWATSVHNLINGGYGCPQCAPNRSWAPEERIAQINALPNISFVRWDGEYRNLNSRAVYRCGIDGCEWATNLGSLLAQDGSGCPQCSGMRRWTAEERVSQINALPNISFVRWEDVYKNVYSKAICRCAVDGFEWAAQVHSLLNLGTGCPQCSPCGYNPAKPATLYVLRSECGVMTKIGISNYYKQRHAQLRRATPFKWSCIELVHSNDGAFIAELEKELHSWTEPVEFINRFDGHTEWRKWDDRLPKWIARFRLKVEAP